MANVSGRESGAVAGIAFPLHPAKNNTFFAELIHQYPQKYPQFRWLRSNIDEQPCPLWTAPSDLQLLALRTALCCIYTRATKKDGS